MKILFHHPLPLNKESRSASGIRPIRMLNAFRSLGYEVVLIVGNSKERKKRIKVVEEKIRSGVQFDFCYSESSTMPTILTDPHHLPLRPLVDVLFFRFLRRNNIPIGLFYRDIYWLFSSYGKSLSFFKKNMAKIGYVYDLLVYKKYVNVIYLPSKEMGKYIPFLDKDFFHSLPPGHNAPLIYPERVAVDNRALKLFYVGGISDHYQLHLLFDVVRTMVNKVELTICTRESEWEKVREEYPLLTDNIQIVHKSGVEMEKDLACSDIAVLFVKPQQYWEFAVPVKLYEYIGFEKPILASNGTLSGKYVSETDSGWSVSYDYDSLKGFFESIIDHRDEVDRVVTNLKRIKEENTWGVRAKTVARDLTLK